MKMSDSSGEHHFRVPGFCYPQDIWYRFDPGTGKLGWYGVGLKAAQDVFRLAGLRQRSPRVVTNYGDIVGGVASGVLDMAPLEMGFNHERHSKVDFGPSLAFSRLLGSALGPKT